MERPPSPDQSDDRIARATARVNSAMARVSDAQELVTIAKERLARVCLALQDARTRETHEPPTDDDPPVRDPP
jgi:hypothetical protein